MEWLRRAFGSGDTGDPIEDMDRLVESMEKRLATEQGIPMNASEKELAVTLREACNKVLGNEDEYRSRMTVVTKGNFGELRIDNLFLDTVDPSGALGDYGWVVLVTIHISAKNKLRIGLDTNVETSKWTPKIDGIDLEDRRTEALEIADSRNKFEIRSAIKKTLNGLKYSSLGS